MNHLTWVLGIRTKDFPCLQVAVRLARAPSLLLPLYLPSHRRRLLGVIADGEEEQRLATELSVSLASPIQVPSGISGRRFSRARNGWYRGVVENEQGALRRTSEGKRDQAETAHWLGSI